MSGSSVLHKLPEFAQTHVHLVGDAIQPSHPLSRPSPFALNLSQHQGPTFWSPDMKSWLIGKDSDAGKDWRQGEKATTEDEMVEWRHWLNGREFEQILGDCEGRGSLACCSPWARKESDTTELMNNKFTGNRLRKTELLIPGCKESGSSELKFELGCVWLHSPCPRATWEYGRTGSLAPFDRLENGKVVWRSGDTVLGGDIEAGTQDSSVWVLCFLRSPYFHFLFCTGLECLLNWVISQFILFGRWGGMCPAVVSRATWTVSVDLGSQECGLNFWKQIASWAASLAKLWCLVLAAGWLCVKGGGAPSRRQGKVRSPRSILDARWGLPHTNEHLSKEHSCLINRYTLGLDGGWAQAGVNHLTSCLHRSLSSRGRRAAVAQTLGDTRPPASSPRCCSPGALWGLGGPDPVAHPLPPWLYGH